MFSSQFDCLPMFIVYSSCFTQMMNILIVNGYIYHSRDIFSENFSELSGDISPITCVSEPDVFLQVRIRITKDYSAEFVFITVTNRFLS